MDRRSFLSLSPAFPAAAVSASLLLKEEGKPDIELGLNVLHLKAGDTLVLTLDGRISEDSAERIKAHLQHALPKTKALILGDGMKIEGVLRGAE